VVGRLRRYLCGILVLGELQLPETYAMGMVDTADVGDVLVTGIVAFFFFLACFAVNEPEILLWAVEEAAKKLAWCKPSGRRRTNNAPTTRVTRTHP
jgi:hypothetical protein